MDKRQFYFSIFISSTFGALLASAVIFYYIQQSPYFKYNSIETRQQQSTLAYLPDSATIVPEGLNFITAANKVVPGVVHIRSLYSAGNYSTNPLDGIFSGPSQSSGSGVIISDDGYLVTNHHVIDKASQIEVVLNDNRRYLAKVIGTDPTTDLALLKIEEQNLNFVRYGNSDNIVPGEWVLAVGNPFELNSTVTAGIVSAKARNIGILRDRSNLQIESFIQTDAAVNPGNSGGALVNLRGELVGVNTAIATPTGSYSGYSFAVPVTLVKKVMDDLLEFGAVQRGLLGIRIGDMNADIANAQGVDVLQGVFVTYVNENSAAEEAGILPGDVIVAINGTSTTNVSELQELVARNRPGDKIQVNYIRNNKTTSVEATLKNTEGNVNTISNIVHNEIEGAIFEDLQMHDLGRFDIDGGIKIKSLSKGKWKDAGLKEGFIITKIDKHKVLDISDLNQILKNKKGAILVEGFTENGKRSIYGIDW